MPTVNEAIRKLIEDSGENPHSLAPKVQIPQPTLFRIISGETREPKRANLDKLAKFYGVSAEALSHGIISANATVQVHGVSATGDAGQVDPVIQYLAVLLPEDADVWRAQIKAAATKRMRELGKLEAPPDIKKDPLSA